MRHFFQQIIQLPGMTPGGGLVILQEIPENCLQAFKTVFQITDLLSDTPQGSSLIHLREGLSLFQLLFQLVDLADTALEQGNMFFQPATVYKKVHGSEIT